MLGRVRLLRGAAYEKLGQPAQARAQYEAVLDQWKAADPALDPYLSQARLRLARLTGVG